MRKTFATAALVAATFSGIGAGVATAAEPTVEQSRTTISAQQSGGGLVGGLLGLGGGGDLAGGLLGVGGVDSLLGGLLG